ncbi:hypothetical protein, partial [Rhizobium sp. Root268]
SSGLCLRTWLNSIARIVVLLSSAGLPSSGEAIPHHLFRESQLLAGLLQIGEKGADRRAHVSIVPSKHLTDLIDSFGLFNLARFGARHLRAHVLVSPVCTAVAVSKLSYRLALRP